VGKLSATSAPEEAANQIVGGQAQPINADGLWHARLGHVSPTKMQLISKLCDGVPPPASGNDGVCGGCIQGKLSTSPFARQSGNEIKTSRPFEILHSDLMGPMKPKSKGGAQYVLTFVDDYSRYVHVYLLSSKAQVFEKFHEYKVMVETQYGRRIRCIRTDKAGSTQASSSSRCVLGPASSIRLARLTRRNRMGWQSA
jgi:hypothetical protein